MFRVLTVFVVLAVSALAGLSGCTQYTPPEKTQLLQREETLDVIVVVADLSGSFDQRMKSHGWAFTTTLLKNFKRDLAGEDGTKIILAQISGAPQGPIFDGSLRSFGKRMGGSSEFHNFLQRHANAAGSRVFDSISEAVEYSTQFVGPNTRAGVFCLTDMDDNASASGGEERLVRAFTAFGKKGGSIGLYWVDLDKVEKWETNLRRAGVKNFIVESAIVADPTFPNYER